MVGRTRTHHPLYAKRNKSTPCCRLLDEANIFVWDGNYYALEVTTRLGLEDKGDMARVGPVPLPLGLQHGGGVGEVWRGVKGGDTPGLTAAS